MSLKRGNGHDHKLDFVRFSPESHITELQGMPEWDIESLGGMALGPAAGEITLLQTNKHLNNKMLSLK